MNSRFLGMIIFFFDRNLPSAASPIAAKVLKQRKTVGWVARSKTQLIPNPVWTTYKLALTPNPSVLAHTNGRFPPVRCAALKLGSGCNRAEVSSACVAPSRGEPEPQDLAGEGCLGFRSQKKGLSSGFGITHQHPGNVGFHSSTQPTLKDLSVNQAASFNLRELMGFFTIDYYKDWKMLPQND